jgi:flavin-dependent dehydrogenase
VRKAGGTVVWHGVIRQMSFDSFGYDRPALHVEREDFDKVLLDHAKDSGALVFEEVAALSADCSGDEKAVVSYRPVGESGTATIDAKYVIDASGQTAVLARQYGLRFMDDAFRFMSIWGYFKNSKYVSPGGIVQPFENLRTVPPTTFVSSLDGLGDWGWLWHIPQKTSTSVGLVLPHEHMKTVKTSGTGQEALESYFLEVCRRTPYLNRLLEEAEYVEGSFRGIRDYSYRTTQLSGPRFFLAGDAAAFVDPIFSVGVLFAMYGGWLAAWTVDRSLQHESQAESNRRLFEKQLMGRIEVSRQLALPQYQSSGRASELARETVKFESRREQELMRVVSAFTTRGENVLDMVPGRDGETITTDKYRILDEIVF